MTSCHRKSYFITLALLVKLRANFKYKGLKQKSIFNYNNQKQMAL